MGGWDGAGGGDGGMGGMVVGVGSDPGWDYLGGEGADLFRAPSEVDFSSHYRKYETFWPNCQIEETPPTCLEISHFIDPFDLILSSTLQAMVAMCTFEIF